MLINRKRKIVYKLIAIVLIQAFILYDIVWATDGKLSFKTTTTENHIQANIISRGIPYQYGEIKETFVSKDNKASKCIIHIQDAHVNYEAQKSLASIIQELFEQYNVNLILVEGGSGDVNLSYLRKYPLERRKTVAEQYLKEGKISGEEYLTITSTYPLEIYGVENKRLYQDNLEALFEVDAFREESHKCIDRLKEKINLLKQFLFNKKLLTFSDEKDRFHKGNNFLRYSDFLNEQAGELTIDITAYPNYTILRDVKTKEKAIDFKQVNSERNELIHRLTKMLYRPELEGLTRKSIAFKANRISANKYYGYLKDLAVKAGILLEDYGNVLRYIEYTDYYETIDVEALFEEIALLEKEIKSKYFENIAQQKLDDISDKIAIVTDLFNFKLLPRQYRYYTTNRADFSVDRWLSFINGYLRKFDLGTINIGSALGKTQFKKIEIFYNLVAQRDQHLVDNALSVMNKTGEDSAILIAGGFHTGNLMHLLRTKQVSYIVMAPKITKGDFNDEIYTAILKLKSGSTLRPPASKGTIIAPQLEADIINGTVTESGELAIQQIQGVPGLSDSVSEHTDSTDNMERLKRLFRAENFDEGKLSEALQIIDTVLQDPVLSYATRVKLVLAARQLFLNPDIEPQRLAEELSVNRADVDQLVSLIQKSPMRQLIVSEVLEKSAAGTLVKDWLKKALGIVLPVLMFFVLSLSIRPSVAQEVTERVSGVSVTEDVTETRQFFDNSGDEEEEQDDEGIQPEITFPRLTTDGAVIKADGKDLYLRGIALADPAMVADPHYNEKDFDELVAMGVNAVRLPLHPEAHTPPRFDIVDRYIKMAHERGIWVIIDYHDFGRNLLNPETITWWRTVAAHYAGKDGIIYELFNETHSLEPQEWRDGYNALISAIREIDKDTLLLIGGLDWGYDLRHVRDGFGVVDSAGNFAYATHPYPGKPGENEDRWGYLMSGNTVPVVVTEFGYDQDGSGKEFDSDGSSTRQLLDYIKNSATQSWIAWCYHPQWKPRIISDWDHTRTLFGNDLADALDKVKDEETRQKRISAIQWMLKTALLAMLPIAGWLFSRLRRKTRILKNIKNSISFLKDMLPSEEQVTARDIMKNKKTRIKLMQTLMHNFTEFAQKANIIRGSPSNETITRALSFLVTLLNRPQQLDKNNLPTTFDKKEIDIFINTLDGQSTLELFKVLDNLAVQIGLRRQRISQNSEKPV